jgi:large subunit ribosomal protein L15
MNLAEVNRGIHKHKKKKRVGRGQLAGWSAPPIFEGGASPLIRRIPKRGFNNSFAKTVAAVNVGSIDEVFAAGDEVTIESLRAKDLVSGRFDELKILGNGELKKKLTISAHRFSASAREKIAKAGGTLVELAGKTHASVHHKKNVKAKKS